MRWLMLATLHGGLALGAHACATLGAGDGEGEKDTKYFQGDIKATFRGVSLDPMSHGQNTNPNKNRNPRRLLQAAAARLRGRFYERRQTQTFRDLFSSRTTSAFPLAGCLFPITGREERSLRPAMPSCKPEPVLWGNKPPQSRLRGAG